MSKFTEKQKLFCREYLVDLNATQASIRAGYSKKTAQRMGSENLSKPLIQEFIQKNIDKRAERTEITADMVIKEIAKLAFIDISKIFDKNGNLKPIVELPNEVSAAISSVEITRQLTGKGEDPEFLHKIKLWDKKGALELLARHFNLLSDKPLIDNSQHIQVTNIDLKDKSPNELTDLLMGRYSNARATSTQ